jgi:hypothetical protein
LDHAIEDLVVAVGLGLQDKVEQLKSLDEDEVVVVVDNQRYETVIVLKAHE